ncbi:MAG: universal stress protein [Caldilineaceae bacterium]
MKRKILVTLDGSALSKKVLSAVRQLFAPPDTELILLQVIDPLTYSPYIVPMTPTLTWDPQLIEHEWVDHRRMIVEDINSVAHALEAEGYHVCVHIPVGDPIHEICGAARSEQVDIVAMATHGRSGIMRLMLGSVAEGVLRSISVPVLLVRPEEVATHAEANKANATEPQKDRRSEVVYETPSV